MPDTDYYRTAALEKYLNYVKPFSSKMVDMDIAYQHIDEADVDAEDRVEYTITRRDPTNFDYTFLRILNLSKATLEAGENKMVASIDGDEYGFVFTNFITSRDNVYWEFEIKNIENVGELQLGLMELQPENLSPLWSRKVLDGAVDLTGQMFTITDTAISHGSGEIPINSNDIILTLGIDRSEGELSIYVNGSREATISAIIPERFSSYITFENSDEVELITKRAQYSITGMSRL